LAVILLAIDPGNSTGWAVYAHGRLVECGATNPDKQGCRALWWLAQGAVTEFVGEQPQIYRNSRAKGDPNDLIPVAMNLGRWVERASLAGVRTIKLHLPNEWKGTIPKDVHHRRILPKLHVEERAVLPQLAAKPAGDMMDAVALGLFHLGRVGRGGV
jgi:hypothetical protein